MRQLIMYQRNKVSNKQSFPQSKEKWAGASLPLSCTCTFADNHCHKAPEQTQSKAKHSDTSRTQPLWVDHIRLCLMSDHLTPEETTHPGSTM